MKKDARQWGVVAILLTAVLASGDGGATTVLVKQYITHADLEAERFPLGLSGAMRALALQDEPLFLLPDAFLADWSIAPASGNATFGPLTPETSLPPLPRGDASGSPTHFQTSRPSLSEREMAVWKSNGEPEDWLFRMQFAKASIYEAPKPSPLIPIPEPTTGVLVLLGIAGRLALNIRISLGERDV